MFSYQASWWPQRGQRERAERLVSLPIASDVESLNVAVATGILLYELCR